MGGSGSVNVLGGAEITVSGCWKEQAASGEVNPDPIENAPRQELNEAPIPDCTGLPLFGSVQFGGAGVLQPGIYDDIQLKAGADVTMQPGLYCLRGSGGAGWTFETKGGSALRGDGVMFYLLDTAQGVKSAGGSFIDLKAPTDLRDGAGNLWAGMLIYGDPGFDKEIILTGSSNTSYEGTIYALEAYCNIEGTADGVALTSQVICDTIQISGSGNLDLSYDEGKNYHIPNLVDLSQ